MPNNDSQSAYQSRFCHDNIFKWHRRHSEFFTCYRLCIIDGLDTRTLWKQDLFYRLNASLKLRIDYCPISGPKSSGWQLDALMFVKQHSGSWCEDGYFISGARVLPKCWACYQNIYADNYSRCLRRCINYNAGNLAIKLPDTIQCDNAINCFVVLNALRHLRKQFWGYSDLWKENLLNWIVLAFCLWAGKCER
jgi:hypothetical protein